MTLLRSGIAYGIGTGLERRPCAIHLPYPHDPVSEPYGQDPARIESPLRLTLRDSVLIYLYNPTGVTVLPGHSKDSDTVTHGGHGGTGLTFW